jgi:hypothetical protein
MATPASTTEFLDLVRQSGVVPERQLLQILAGIDDPPQDPARLAAILIKRGLLTNFQAKLLLAGKYRGFRVGSYLIRDQLGQGGMGTVYLAEHETLRRRVALKMLAKADAAGPAGVERFLREARAAAALDHPNIVRIFDVGRQGPMHYLVMEYVDGHTLEQVLARGPIPCGRAAEYITQAAAGLQHAYEKGFVHRDIKPANLMLARDGTVKILDMGLARPFDTDDKLTERLDQGVILGTADYISPEQAINSPAVDIRSDVYSLGATFFALVTGKPPFEGNTTQKLMQHQMRDAPFLGELDPTFPPQLAEAVAVMMAKRPEDRFQTPAEVIAALSPWVPSSAQVVAGLSGTDLGKAELSTGDGSQVTLSEMMASRTRRMTGRLPAPSRRKRTALIGGAVAAGVLVVVGGLIWALSGRDPEPTPPGGQTTVAAAPAPPAKATPAPKPATPTSKVTPPPAKAPPAAKPAFVPLALGPAAQARSNDLLIPTTGKAAGSTRNRLVFPDWGPKEFKGVPFRLIDPAVSANIIALYSSNQPKTAALPRSVTLPVNAPAAAVHVLGGVSGWGWPCEKGASGIGAPKNVPSVVVRVRYADGPTEDHVWKNGVHLADYNGRREVTGSVHAYELENGHQARYLVVRPKRDAAVREVEFAKAAEDEYTCPIIFAVTVETRGQSDAATGAATPTVDTPAAIAPDFTKVKPFRRTVRDGQPVEGDLLPAGLSAGCAKPEAVGEFRAEVADGRTVLGLTNLTDARSARLTFDLAASLRPGQEYKVVVEYRTANDASAMLSVRDRSDVPRVKVSLDGTGGEWRTAELVFRRSADAPTAAVVENTAVGEGNTLSVRRFEVQELK